jgi:hypothetical protein
VAPYPQQQTFKGDRMTDDAKTTFSRPIEPVQVAVIGTGDGSKLADCTVAVTAGAHEPNIIVTVVGPLLAIVIRFVNVFLVQLVGLLIAGMTPAGAKLLYTGDFLHLVVVCSSLALPGAGLGFIKDLVTVFGRLESKYPLLTGSV